MYTRGRVTPALQERLENPGQQHLQSCRWKQESPGFSFRAPSAAQRSDGGHSHLLSGQEELFTRKISKDRVTGQASEQVTLRKAVLHPPEQECVKSERRDPFQRARL